MNSHEVFIHIHQSCFAGTGAIVRLPHCQWSKPGGYGKISQCITTTKHSKTKTVCIFLGIYCNRRHDRTKTEHVIKRAYSTLHLDSPDDILPLNIGLKKPFISWVDKKTKMLSIGFQPIELLSRYHEFTSAPSALMGYSYEIRNHIVQSLILMMTLSNGNTFRVTGPLCREFTGHRWIPLTKASDAELWCFLWFVLEQTVE